MKGELKDKVARGVAWSMAEKIGTMEMSSLPYEDCFTVFTPRHPATRPKMDIILEGESKLDTEALIAAALENTEVIDL